MFWDNCLTNTAVLKTIWVFFFSIIEMSSKVKQYVQHYISCFYKMLIHFIRFPLGPTLFLDSLGSIGCFSLSPSPNIISNHFSSGYIFLHLSSQTMVIVTVSTAPTISLTYCPTRIARHLQNQSLHLQIVKHWKESRKWAWKTKKKSPRDQERNHWAGGHCCRPIRLDSFETF